MATGCGAGRDAGSRAESDGRRTAAAPAASGGRRTVEVACRERALAPRRFQRECGGGRVAGADRQSWGRQAAAANPYAAESRPQRSLPMWQWQEVQAVSRPAGVMLAWQ